MHLDQIQHQLEECKPCYLGNVFPKIFSWEELERLLNLRPFVNTRRLRVIDDEGYSWNDQAWLTEANTFPPSLLNNILKRKVCYLSDCSRVNKEINSICGELEDLFLNSAADAHIYFTVANTMEGGFGIHWDYSHNLIVQVEGNTRFLLWDVYAQQGETKRVVESLDQDPLVDVTLNPGDAIFVPMRSYHQAISQTKRLSVSFPISFDNELSSQDRKWIELNL